MKKSYQSPEMELRVMDVLDVISTSDDNRLEWDTEE